MKANPTTKYEWVDSIQTLLESVDYGDIQSRSISIVPEGLKKWNEDAYMPRVVSIGPRFMGSREDLLLMEEVKLRCMLSLIHRAGKTGDAPEYLQKCCEAVWEFDEQVRSSYAAKINLEKHELAKTTLVDGCFLLELLISKGMDAQLPSRLMTPGPAPEVLKYDDILSDLMLLENQIPIFVLHKLSNILFPSVFNSDRVMRMTRINNLVLSILGYPLPQVQSLEATHILDIVHFFVNRKAEREKEISEDFNHVVVDIPAIYKALELKRCALRLLTGGITIKLPEDNSGELSCFGLLRNCFGGILIRLGDIFVNTKHLNFDMQEEELRGLDFEFKLRKGVLEIAQLHITKTTEAKWCNVMVWEHCKKNRNKSFNSETGYASDDEILENLSTTSPNGKFTSAALIFNGLICCADDVQILKDKNIIVDHLKMSNDELLAFFGTISFGADHGVVDSSYIKMVHELNNYSPAFFPVRIWKTVLSYFTYSQLQGRLIRFMNRNYNFVGTLFGIFTVVQTVYAILAYYLRK